MEGERGDGVIMLFECVFFFLMIRRPPGSTQSGSSAASDVYKGQAKRSLSAQQNAPQGVLPDTFVGGPEASAEKVRTRHLSADRFCQGLDAEVNKTGAALRVRLISHTRTSVDMAMPQIRGTLSSFGPV